MTKISKKRVLITGGASGIGKLMGGACLAKKAIELIIWDINERALKDTTKEFKIKGYSVSSHLVDVSIHPLTSCRSQIEEVIHVLLYMSR